MALTLVVHHKRPAPSSAEAGGGKKRRQRYFKMPLAEEYYELKFDDDIDDDAVEEDHEVEFHSVDGYEMLEEFGASSSAVAKARDRGTGETVAVKRVRASDGDDGTASLCAVVREARCMDACAGHPCILQLRGMAADEKTGDLFIVTEPQQLGAGARTLRSLLTRRFSEAETRAFMRQLLGAAEIMHGAGITHRDINPDNVVVGPDGALQICGFRCAIQPAARLVGEQHPPMGTRRYCSPSQLNGVRCYCAEEDMWALGCVMAELLAGAPLFTADNEEELLGQTIELADEIMVMGVDGFEFLNGVPMPELSLAARELLVVLLESDEKNRPTAADALKHSWFTEDEAKADSSVVPCA